MAKYFGHSFYKTTYLKYACQVFIINTRIMYGRADMQPLLGDQFPTWEG
jgi:hypothetical protein